uniref:Uncharacterized protein n=1 Tax=Zea mays TaxID=4577 RepID=C0HJ70_MAIZE|nr:unknown [Zea mays]
MDNCNSSATSMKARLELSKTSDSAPGTLEVCSTCSTADLILQSVLGIVSAGSWRNPGRSTWLQPAAKRMLRYVVGTTDWCRHAHLNI